MSAEIGEKFGFLRKYGFRQKSARMFTKAGGYQVVASKDGHSVYATSIADPVRFENPTALDAFLSCIFGSVCRIRRAR